MTQLINLPPKGGELEIPQTDLDRIAQAQNHVADQWGHLLSANKQLLGARAALEAVDKQIESANAAAIKSGKPNKSKVASLRRRRSSLQKQVIAAESERQNAADQIRPHLLWLIKSTTHNLNKSKKLRKLHRHDVANRRQIHDNITLFKHELRQYQKKLCFVDQRPYVQGKVKSWSVGLGLVAAVLVLLQMAAPIVGLPQLAPSKIIQDVTQPLNPNKPHGPKMASPKGLAKTDKFGISYRKYALVYNAAYNAGFRGEKLYRALAVSSGESSMTEHGPDLVNHTTGHCGPSNRDRGAWQINSCWHAEVTDACAYNYQCAANSVYRISHGGRNWKAWCTWFAGCDGHTPGVAQQRLPAVRKVVAYLKFNGFVGVSTRGFVFPLKTTKSVIRHGSVSARGRATWCISSVMSCHHDYHAADIMAPTGTQVLAVRSGRFIKVDDDSGVGGNLGYTVKILGDDGLTYYYAHMLRSSESSRGGSSQFGIKLGDRIKAGQPIGYVGTSHDAEGTQPHLHLGILNVSRGFQCFQSNCPDRGHMISPQPVLRDAYQRLPA